MSASLAILTIGIVPMQEVLPLLTEYIDEDNISHHSLLGKLSREEAVSYTHLTLPTTLHECRSRWSPYH